MFEIFGALFGGAYLIHKIGSENAIKQDNDARMQRFNMRRNQVTNSNLEWEWREKMSFRTNAKYGEITKALKAREQMVSEVSEKDMAYVFGLDWKELFAKKPLAYLSTQLPGCDDGCFKCIHEVAFNLWMSQKGYIVAHHCSHSGYSAKHIIDGLPDNQQGRRYGITSRAIKVIERNVKRKHPDLAVVQDPLDPKRKIWNIWADVIR